jgi:uncharacterized protein YqjF (DUF2071 family)
MLQRWRSLTFLHWRYEAGEIRRLLPNQVMLDTFDGSAWVGLTPFLLTDLRLPFGPALPWISRFPETNVRTYVRGPDGEPGVWFFTLEAARLAAVLGARLTYALPYRWADMRVSLAHGRVKYQSTRKRPFGYGDTNISIKPAESMRAGEFDNFLTARYRLYTVRRSRLGYAQIEHDPWPLQHGKVLELGQNLIEKSGVPRPSGDPVVHYSADLEVRIGRIQW